MPKETKTNGRAEAAEGNKRRRRGNRGNPGETADFGSIDAELLQAVIAAITLTGCALQFSYTRDGGAYVFRIVGDGDEPYNEYIRPTEDIELYLRGLLEDFRG